MCGCLAGRRWSRSTRPPSSSDRQRAHRLRGPRPPLHRRRVRSRYRRIRSSRPFTIDIRAVVKARRQELLSALLTIWRWGRLERVPAGKTLGSFEQWSRWVRDPLLALGCQDPVERISEAKERDSRRQSVSDLFSAWWACHQDKPVAIRDLRRVGWRDPQGRGRQYGSSSRGSPARGRPVSS